MTSSSSYHHHHLWLQVRSRSRLQLCPRSRLQLQFHPRVLRFPRCWVSSGLGALHPSLGLRPHLCLVNYSPPGRTSPHNATLQHPVNDTESPSYHRLPESVSGGYLLGVLVLLADQA